MDKTNASDITLHVLDYEFRQLKTLIKNFGKIRKQEKNSSHQTHIGGC
ncbi:MAG: hypothetical protein ACTSYD_09290 [Candidatus Heimdallarchaeaceae archaeon]